MNAVVKELMRLYERRFGDSFPSIQVGCSRSDSELAEIIRDCLRQNKDAYELGYAAEDDDI